MGSQTLETIGVPSFDGHIQTISEHETRHASRVQCGFEALSSGPRPTSFSTKLLIAFKLMKLPLLLFDF
jgi:hypothetical protein